MSKVTSFPVVRIRPKGMGALPVGLKGKLYGQPFKVVIQYDAFGGVRAQIIEDEPGGGMITEIAGRTGEVDGKADAFANWAISRARKEGLITEGRAKTKYTVGYREKREVRETTDSEEKVTADIKRRSKLFIKDLYNEVKDFNSGKDTKTKKAGPVNVAPKKAAAPKKAVARTVSKTVPVKAYCVKSHKRTIQVPVKK